MDVGVPIPQFPPLWRETRAGVEAAALFRSSVWRGGGVPARKVVRIPYAVDIDQFFNTFPPRVQKALSNFIRGNAAIDDDVPSS